MTGDPVAVVVTLDMIWHVALFGAIAGFAFGFVMASAMWLRWRAYR